MFDWLGSFMEAPGDMHCEQGIVGGAQANIARTLPITAG
jgi:hypothetical protein